MISAAVARLARYYSLPSFVAGGQGDTKVSDFQSGHEKPITALLPALAGANRIDGLGMIEMGMTFDFGQLVLDNEVAQMVKHAVTGIPVNDETLAVDVTNEIGIGKDFLNHDSTYRHMRSLSAPMIFDRTISGVEKECEVIMSYDGGTNKVGRLGINTGRLQVLQLYERCFGADTTELSDLDYGFKQVKHIIRENVPLMEQAQLLMVAPVFYGAMPNIGLYTQPDGPVPNPAELLPRGKIKEAREAYEDAIEHAVRDLVLIFLGKHHRTRL